MGCYNPTPAIPVGIKKYTSIPVQIGGRVSLPRPAPASID